MAQQVNLCTPILLAPKHYFSAQTMVQTLGVFVVLGSVLCGAWVWNLQHAAGEFSQLMVAQKQEIESLQSAIARSHAAARPADPALLAQLQDRRSAVAQREKLLVALQQGMLRPGWAHSDRLQWVARSIPAPVWVTVINITEGRFEVSGFTLEPAALNDWVGKLSTSPLMQSMKLATVKVESTAAAQIRVPVAAAAPVSGAPLAASAIGARPVWSFTLISQEPPPSAVVANDAPRSQP